MEPASQTRRAFAYRRLVEAGATFEALGETAIATGYRNATDEGETAKRMGLADLTPLPRIGFKGKGTTAWLDSQGVTIPGMPNRAAAQSDGGLALRLADQEILLLGSLDCGSADPTRLEEAWTASETPSRGFPLPRQETHAWFVLSGEKTDAMLAKLCGVDLRSAKFADLSIAQTSIARMTGVLCRQDLGGTLAYHFLADSASASYLWDCLMDAMAEFRGGPVGLSAVQSLTKA